MSIVSSFFSRRVLAVCNHPGGANAIFPILVELKKKGVNCYSVSSRIAYERFIEAGIKSRLIKDKISYETADKIIRFFNPDIILLGTSEPEDPDIGRLESVFTVTARKNNVPTVAVLDQWYGYVDRFSLSNKMLSDALPDIICVMDERAKSEMVNEGFHEDCIVITGNPHWDALEDIRKSLFQINREELRNRLGMNVEERSLLFVSQPIFKDRRLKWGYTETKVLEDILTAVQYSDFFKEAAVWVKLHPREDGCKISHLAKSASRNRIKIIGDKADSYHIGRAADIIIGMTSMLLLEYSLLGLPVISYQPVEGKIAPFCLGHKIMFVNTLDALQNILQHWPLKWKVGYTDVSFNATRRVIEVLNNILERNVVR